MTGVQTLLFRSLLDELLWSVPWRQTGKFFGEWAGAAEDIRQTAAAGGVEIETYAALQKYCPDTPERCVLAVCAADVKVVPPPLAMPAP